MLYIFRISFFWSAFKTKEEKAGKDEKERKKAEMPPASVIKGEEREVA